MTIFVFFCHWLSLVEGKFFSRRFFFSFFFPFFLLKLYIISTETFKEWKENSWTIFNWVLAREKQRQSGMMTQNWRSESCTEAAKGAEKALKVHFNGKRRKIQIKKCTSNKFENLFTKWMPIKSECKQLDERITNRNWCTLWLAISNESVMDWMGEKVAGLFVH